MNKKRNVIGAFIVLLFGTALLLGTFFKDKSRAVDVTTLHAGKEMTTEAFAELAGLDADKLWEELNKYGYQPIGSGIPYRYYDIDEEYYVLVNELWYGKPEGERLVCLNNRLTKTSISLNYNVKQIKSFIKGGGVIFDASVNEAVYEEFDSLFYEKEALLAALADELTNMNERGFDTFFDIRFGTPGSWYGTNCLCFGYENRTFWEHSRWEGENDDLLAALERSESLKDALDAIEESGLVDWINVDYRNESVQIIFGINPKYAKLVTEKALMDNLIAYSDRKGMEEYGYRHVKDNWYLYISPGAEDFLL